MTLPTFTFEVALGIGSGGFLIFDDPVLGLLDTGLLGPDLVWTDLSDKVQTMNIKTPTRERTLGAYTAGSLTVRLLDNLGNFDPTNTSSTYYVAGVTTLTPNRPCRVLATYNSISYPLWYGYTNRWEPGGNDRTNEQWCTVTATDGFKLLGRNNPVAGGSVGAGELSGDRITRILDNANWSPALRAIAAGNSTLQATTLASNTLSELQLTAASEGGILFCDPSGLFTFLDRYAAVTATRSNTSQATFADASDMAALPYVSPTIATDDEIMINKVQLGRAGGTVQVVSDATSIAVYSSDVPQSWGRTDLLNQSDTEVYDAASWLLSQFKTPENRFTQILVRGEADATRLWPVLLGALIRDRWTLKRRRRGATQFVQDVFLEGIEHNYGIDDKGKLDWTTAVRVVPTTGYGSFLILDSATFGLLDTNQLGY